MYVSSLCTVYLASKDVGVVRFCIALPFAPSCGMAFGRVYVGRREGLRGCLFTYDVINFCAVGPGPFDISGGGGHSLSKF